MPDTPSQEGTRLTALPQEILLVVAAFIYHDSGCRGRTLHNLSFTCHTLRDASLSYLFQTVTFVNHGPVFERQSFSFLLSLVTHNNRIAKHIRDLRFLSQPKRIMLVDDQVFSLDWFGGRDGISRNVSLKSLEVVEQALKQMIGLRHLTFDVYNNFTSAVLRLQCLQQRSLIIAIDTRKHSRYTDERFDKVCIEMPPDGPTWRWSKSMRAHLSLTEPGNQPEPVKLVTDRLIATEWQSFAPASKAKPNGYEQILHEHNTSLRELHLSEKLSYLRAQSSTSLGQSLAAFVTNLGGLRRLSIEVSDLVEQFMPMLGQLEKLESLRMYSAHRAVFHKGCDASLYQGGQPEQLLYLNLPHLRHLDIRYICKHLTWKQYVPRNLLSLRVEHYHSYDQICASDIDWLAEGCPNIRRLEVDTGPLEELSLEGGSDRFFASSGVFVDDHPNHVIRRLGRLKHLEILRLFPSYWKLGRLHPSPFTRQSIAQLFVFLRKICPSLHTLHVSISFGDYPVDAIPDLPERQRPAKHVARMLEPGVVMITTTPAEVDFDIEYMFQILPNDEGSTDHAVPRVRLRTEKQVPHRWCKQFFEDLHEGWDLEYFELPERERRAVKLTLQSD